MILKLLRRLTAKLIVAATTLPSQYDVADAFFHEDSFYEGFKSLSFKKYLLHLNCACEAQCLVEEI